MIASKPNPYDVARAFEESRDARAQAATMSESAGSLSVAGLSLGMNNSPSQIASIWQTQPIVTLRRQIWGS